MAQYVIYGENKRNCCSVPAEKTIPEMIEDGSVGKVLRMAIHHCLDLIRRVTRKSDKTSFPSG